MNVPQWVYTVNIDDYAIFKWFWEYNGDYFKPIVIWRQKVSDKPTIKITEGQIQS